MRLRLIVGEHLAADEDGNVYGLTPVWNQAHDTSVPTWLLYRPDYIGRAAGEFHWQRPSGAGGGCMVSHDLDALIDQYEVEARCVAA